MNQNSSVRKLARCAVVAAIYVVLCMALQPFSYGAVQVRVAEALCLLPVFGRRSAGARGQALCLRCGRSHFVVHRRCRAGLQLKSNLGF